MEEEKVHMVIEDLNHYIPQQYQVKEGEIQGNNSDLEPQLRTNYYFAQLI